MSDEHFGQAAANGQAMSAHAGILALQERPTPGTINDLTVVAAQLVEAACRARDGDHEATRAHIAHAVKLLQGMPSLAPSSAHVTPAAERRISLAGLPAWQSRRIVAHIEANLARTIRVRELAKLAGLSESHFYRAFKSTFDASPRAYVLRRRIELAQGLMLTTREPLSSIALRCGMCDQAHFTRSFRRIVGETPRSWRRARQGAMRVD
jgi:AraC family transcriptional regulator